MTTSTISPIPAHDLAAMSPDDRRHARAWNSLVEAAARRAGAPLRWTQRRGWGELTIDWIDKRDTVYGLSVADALRRYVGTP